MQATTNEALNLLISKTDEILKELKELNTKNHLCYTCKFNFISCPSVGECKFYEESEANDGQ